MSISLKARIYNLFDNRSDTPVSLAIGVFFIVLIVVNVLIVIFETVESIKAHYAGWFLPIELFSLAVFSVEYVTRLWCCTVDDRYRDPIRGRLLYVITPLALVDLAAILPTYITYLLPIGLINFLFLRALRLFRVSRVFKLGRYHDSLTTITRVLSNKSGELFVVAFTGFIVLIVSSSAMFFIEHDAQPDKFTSIPQTMWWGVETLTTIGYGEMYPITWGGKVLAAVISLMGIALFALPAGILGSGFFDEIQRRRETETGCSEAGTGCSDTPSLGVSVADELEKAIALRDAGELTREEFGRYKKKLLE